MITEELSYIHQQVKDVERQQVKDAERILEFLKKLEFENNETTKQWLERQFEDNLEKAAISDKITRLQRLVDEVKEFTRDKKLYQLKQVIEVTLDELKQFPSSAYQSIHNEVIGILQLGVKTLSNSFDLLIKSVENLRSIGKLSSDSGQTELRFWAWNLEVLAEELENGLPLLESKILNTIEEVCIEIVLRTRIKSKDAKALKEVYRRRLRFAAGFILNLIETAREEAEAEDEEIFQDMQSLIENDLNDVCYEDDELWNLE